jgi:Tetrapyrrole (Corrin/Porphyrin) Methylases
MSAGEPQVDIRSARIAPSGYPDPESHRRRWRALARAIAEQGSAITDDPAAITAPERVGSLEILGSGIEAVGFTRADEARIRSADAVFYCVADPATKVWLMSERPDAYDLYTLYDDRKRRYVTYMQMAEAMLHPVRQGQRVVAVFYGHPGIFVLATHRAVQIARREGHRAEMRAAVSALDTLCSDLGVDPSQPGMQMYEATDMLIRARRPDPGLHLVLWQVGLIGELGYRRQGYLNTNFSTLLDYLETLYDPDHPVINYVGSRYPGIDPIIDHQTIKSLRDPAVQHWVTGISTFYLPPRAAAPADAEMLVKLGLLAPGQSLRDNRDPLRVIDRYGPRERQAFSDFATFDVPQSYQWQPDTAPARFILDLCESESLRERYRANPVAAVAAWSGGLSARERELLARRDAGAIQLAAKGMRTSSETANRLLLERLLDRKTASAGLLAAVKAAAPGTVQAAAEGWSAAQSLEADWSLMAGDLQALLRRNLAAWSGFYLISGACRSISVFGRCSGGVIRVDLDGQRLAGVRFDKGVLTWSAEAGNACSGYLQPDLTHRGRRRWIGLIWPAGAMPDACHKLTAVELIPRPRLPLSAIAGRYAHGGHEYDIHPADGAMVVLRDTVVCDAPVSVANDHFRVDGARIPIASRIVETMLPNWLNGDYRLRVQHGALAEIVPMTLVKGMMEIGGRPAHLHFDGFALMWHGGPAQLTEGRLEATLDPVTLHPLLHGTACSASGKVATLRGMAVVSDAQAKAISAAPRMGVPDWAWHHLVALVAGVSVKGGLYLWHGHERAGTNLGRVRMVLARLHNDSIG